jgi:hypothetical protein
MVILSYRGRWDLKEIRGNARGDARDVSPTDRNIRERKLIHSNSTRRNNHQDNFSDLEYLKPANIKIC